MKIKLQLAISLTALLIISNTLPVCAESADGLFETTTPSQTSPLIPGSSSSEEWESVTSGDYFPSSDDTPEQEPSNDEPEESGMTVPGEAPMFSAYIEYSPQGYLARGTFTEFLPNTSLVSPLYSLDGEVWQNCQTTWDLQWLGSETADDLKHLQNQTCLYSTHEPLASYLAGQLDRFYLKLQITLENGITYETRAAVIDRGDPQPIPEKFHPVANFVSDMLVRQWMPFMRYGQYQITVRADSTPEDISDLLPNTLPIEIQFYDGINFAANAIVDCPVTWKPLSLSKLTADESVTIADAAEEIIVPAGTLLNTPCGIFQLNEPLSIDNDEIRLVLNVVSENAVPTGVLAYDMNGLQIAFHLKPTGATAIRAYTLSEDESDWVELPVPLLPEEVNAPSSTASSAYTFLLRNTSEPYQTYLTTLNAGDEPTAFSVGLKIEGGVYDGRELILAWPDTYELPTKLPSLSGSGGNECNAGSDNKDDSTLDGQRPGLPQDPENRPNAQEPEPPQDPKDGQEAKEPESPQNPKDGQNTAEAETPQNPKDEQDTKEEPQPPASYIPAAKPEMQSAVSQAPADQQPELPDILEKESNDQQTQQISITKPLPALTVGAEKPVSAPGLSAETGSPTGGKNTLGTKLSVYRFLLSAAATIAMGLCIAAAAGKVLAGNMSGRISRKIMRVIYRFLHLK